MIVVETKSELREIIKTFRNSNPTNRIGFVPTMGALHDGHLSLVKESKKQCDFTEVSIFINPAQFNDPEDLKRYPVDIKRDLALCEEEGVDLVFTPSREEMFPEGTPVINISYPDMMKTLCAPGRPGHFNGVLMIVARLLNLFGCDAAFFGKKDYQQYMLISQMVRDLDIPTEIVGCPICRENDGLAMSSRNVLLAPGSREHATLINRALKIGKKAYEDRKTMPDEIIEIVSDIIASGSMNRVEYVQIVDLRTLEEIAEFTEGVPFLIAVGAFCGEIRLIDNIECGFIT